MLNNIVPPAYVLMDSFKIKWAPSTIIVGILSICCCPWLLVTPESAEGLSLFTRIYSAFLGPIFAVMVVDYYILRRQKLDLNQLYDRKGTFKGVNIAGILAVLLGSCCSLFLVDLSWYVSLIPTGVIYYLLMRYLNRAAPFRTGTIFAKSKS